MNYQTIVFVCALCALAVAIVVLNHRPNKANRWRKSVAKISERGQLVIEPMA